MNTVMKLPDNKFLEVIKNTPLVAIDLIIKNNQGEILLGQRINYPAKGYWFVPGGRIMKNETIQLAFKRILKTETNLDYNFKNTKLLGAYDHIYTDNYLKTDGINTHYVVLGYELNLEDGIKLKKDSQHTEYRWWSVKDLLLNDMVHDNTKNYF